MMGSRSLTTREKTLVGFALVLGLVIGGAQASSMYAERAAEIATLEAEIARQVSGVDAVAPPPQPSPWFADGPASFTAVRLQGHVEDLANEHGLKVVSISSIAAQDGSAARAEARLVGKYQPVIVMIDALAQGDRPVLLPEIQLEPMGEGRKRGDEVDLTLVVVGHVQGTETDND